MKTKQTRNSPGIICIASNSSTPKAQVLEEKICRKWCAKNNVKVIGVYREDLVNGKPSRGYWVRYHSLLMSLRGTGDTDRAFFAGTGCKLENPDIDPKSDARVLFKRARGEYYREISEEGKQNKTI